MRSTPPFMNDISSYRGTLRPPHKLMPGDILERGVSQLRTLHIQITVPSPPRSHQYERRGQRQDSRWRTGIEYRAS